LLAAGVYGAAGIYTISGALGVPRTADAAGLIGAYVVWGLLFLIIGALAAGATLLTNKSRAWFVGAPVILACGLPLALISAFWIDMEKGDFHRRQLDEEMQSGRYAFGDQPTLLAVARAIRANDQDAICKRSDAKARRCSVGR